MAARAIATVVSCALYITNLGPVLFMAAFRFVSVF